jgi:hypothetical protein
MSVRNWKSNSTPPSVSSQPVIEHRRVGSYRDV